MQGWFVEMRAAWFVRLGLLASALFMIEGGWLTDLIGLSGVGALYLVQKVLRPDPNASIPVRGAD